MEQQEELLPPPGLIVDGHRQIFLESGRELFAILREISGLGPDERVLDVGCGAGRMAVPLIPFLAAEGRYEGFDVSEKRIDWLNEAIASRFPNFRFQRVDVYNKTYNWKGAVPGTAFEFPYADQQFDFALVISVFTHMLPDDVRHYLSEIRRVLKPGGRFVASYFLLNPESLDLVAKTGDRRKYPAWNAHQARFEDDLGGYRVGNRKSPEAVVALDESLVLGFYEELRLSISQPVHYGDWSGLDSDVPGGQDLILAYR